METPCWQLSVRANTTLLRLFSCNVFSFAVPHAFHVPTLRITCTTVRLAPFLGYTLRRNDTSTRVWAHGIDISSLFYDAVSGGLIWGNIPAFTCSDWNSQSRKPSPGRHLNPGRPEYDGGELNTRPRHSIRQDPNVHIDILTCVKQALNTSLKFSAKQILSVTLEKSFALGSEEQTLCGETYGPCQKYKALTLQNVAF
jgi:hypothetical protein